MPKDVDVTDEGCEATPTEPRPRRRRDGRWPDEQRGIALAALVAFLGVAYLGPALARMLRQPRFEDRIAVRLRDARRQAKRAGRSARKRVRRLGGGTIRS